MRPKIKRPAADPVKARTRAMHATLRRRAGGTEVIDLESFRALYDNAMRKPLCPYCNAALSESNVSLDHLTPVNRGGHHLASNLAFVCRPCNKAKGQMSWLEYTSLLIMLDKWATAHHNPKLRDEVLTTLKVGNSFRIGKQRRAKRDP